jgi:Ca2+-binding RTX toxin-like protein
MANNRGDNTWTDTDGLNKFNGGNGIDQFHGLDGDDVLHGNWGDDQLWGDDGDDRLYGGQGNDMLDGGNGDDRLFGGEGDDILDGGLGTNTINGGHGDDVLYVSSNSSLAGGGTSGTLTGGNGADTFNFTKLGVAGWNDGKSTFDYIVKITDFESGTDKMVFRDDGYSDYWLFEPGSQPGEYVENLDDAGSLAALGAAANAAHHSGADYYFGVYNGDGYLIADDIHDSWGTVIKLTGVTDMDGSDITVEIV